MESKRSPSVDNDEPKNTFRKPANDGGNRKYRRRTPVGGSSSSDESPKCNDISSPMVSKEDKTEKQGRKYMSRDDRGYNPSEHVRKSESSRYSSRTSQGYDRHDEHKSGKHVPEEDGNYSKPSSRPSQSDHRERRNEFGRSRDHYRDVDKYSRDRAGSDRRHGRHNMDESAYDDRDRSAKDRDYRDEKRDSQRISRDHKRYEESRGHRDDTSSKGETSRHLVKGGFKNELKTEGDKRANEEWKKPDEKYHNRWKETDYKVSEERSNDVDADVTTKRQKFSSCDNAGPRTDGSKQSQEDLAKSIPDQANIAECGGDVDAAKDAAMKAAALVNQNLYGAGTMTADQKKKLLWGNKKKNTLEETSQRWTTAIFPDQERQEKFNKLMGVKGDCKVEQKPISNPLQAEKVQIDLEKQYTAGLRRRDGRTVGLGL